MIDETQPEFTDEAFSAMEGEVAALFSHFLAGEATDEAGSAARHARIMHRVQNEDPTVGDDRSLRINRILARIQEEKRAAAASIEAKS